MRRALAVVVALGVLAVAGTSASAANSNASCNGILVSSLARQLVSSAT